MSVQYIGHVGPFPCTLLTRTKKSVLESGESTVIDLDR